MTSLKLLWVITTRTLALLFISLWVAPIAFGQRETFETNTPDIPMTYGEMSKRFDFAFFVEAEAAERFLDYKGSKLSPVTKITLSYRQYPKPAKINNSDLLKYKELYFAGNVLIGSHQFQSIEIRRGSTGAIRMVDCERFGDFAHPIVDGMLRAFQEMNLNGALMGLVLCPKNHYTTVVSVLNDYQFVPLVDTNGTTTAKVSGTKSAALQLHFWSEPRCKAFEKSYCFISPSGQFAN